MCGNGTPDFLFAVISSDDRWYVGSIVSEATRTLESGDLPDGALPDPDGRAHLSIECAVTADAADRVLVRVNGIAVADFRAAPRIGPFDHAAVYGESGDSPPQTVTFDDITVTSGDTYTPDGRLDPEVEDLLARVPREFRSDCTPNHPAADAVRRLAGLHARQGRGPGAVLRLPEDGRHELRLQFVPEAGRAGRDRRGLRSASLHGELHHQRVPAPACPSTPAGWPASRTPSARPAASCGRTRSSPSSHSACPAAATWTSGTGGWTRVRIADFHATRGMAANRSLRCGCPRPRAIVPRQL